MFLKKSALNLENSAKSLKGIAKASIYLSIFLVPLFFLSGVANVLDFNKQILLVSCVFLSLFCWILSSLLEEKITIK
ncbi:MAG: hypothetical protein ABIF89_01400, partial [bacterium]